MDYVVEKMALLKKHFPDKSIIIVEVGWPSNGRARLSAVASPANEAIFLRRFLDRAAKENTSINNSEPITRPFSLS